MSLCIGFTFQTWRLWPAFLYSLWEKRYCSSNTGIYVSLHVAFQHSPPLFSFPIKKQKPKKNKTQNSVHCPLKPTWLSLRKIICTCKTAWVCEWRKKENDVSFERSGRKFPCHSARYCSVSLKVHACGWKTKPAELCPSALVEKHPPTDRPTSGWIAHQKNAYL